MLLSAMELAKSVSVVAAIFLFSSLTTAYKMRNACTTNSPLVGIINMTETMQAGMYQSTVIHSPMKKGETLCYELTTKGNTEVKSGRKVFISMIDVEQEYQVKFSYNFSIPTMDVKCLCDCPGGTDHCNLNHERESCKSNNYGSGSGNCKKKYSTGHDAIGCLFRDPAEVCCDISVYKQYSTPDYTAIYIDNPLTIYTLEVGFADDPGNVIDKIERIRLLSHTKEANTPVGVIGVVGEGVGNNILTPDWYFMAYSERELLTGEPINNLNERNVNKLGWYKLDAKGSLLSLDWTALKQSLATDVSNCKDSDITWYSSASFYHRRNSIHKPIGHPVSEVLNVKVRVNSTGRSILASSGNTKPILLHTRINASAQIIFRYQKSTMKKFEPKIILDKFGNMQLVLALEQASGSFYGSVELRDSSKESFTLHIPSAKPIDIIQTLPISSKYKCPNKVCLSTEGNQWIQCQTAICVEESLIQPNHKEDDFTETDGIPNNKEKGMLEQFQETFNTLKDSLVGWITHHIKTFIALVGTIIGIILFVLLFCCLSKFGCCCFKSCCNFLCSQKEKEQRVNDEVDSPLHEDKDNECELYYNVHVVDETFVKTEYQIVSNRLDDNGLRYIPQTRNERNEVDIPQNTEKNEDCELTYTLHTAKENTEDDPSVRAEFNKESELS